ncbi:uncharacterized protein PFL1_05286 [Pseudozyma flocculosa PF-1]|uniref:Uncharacterized protein n=2 Tax=Pseudozyma flocculosa TaxID=84751 RepID=A0A5C3FEB8_9BASI|nr:uncharacterized protein PFL1_05286 [Pseudozyma flocculosa PF-1]EPQ27001.1 hypothetical protein PFL1_05286 [Pseudozyma flocculosa PF-1]SPO41997.1 uncharacterized protein PSFLO_07480 [Pseudozyma flocculosa]
MASFLRSSSSSLAVAALSRRALTAPARGFAVSSASRTSDPRVLDNDTLSGASVKADKHDKDPHTLQKEHAQSANVGAGHSGQGGSKLTASPNDAPTQSEDAVHAEKHTKTPEQLQKETAEKVSKSS